MKTRALLLASLLAATGCGSGSRSGSWFASSSPATAAVATASPSASVPTPSVVPVVAPASTATPRSKSARVVARSGEGFLEDQNGRRLLHVKGSPYERGVQYGELLGDEIEAINKVRDDLARTQQNFVPPAVASFLTPLLTTAGAQVYKSHFPAEDLDTLRGICDGARRRTPQVSLRIEDLVFLNAIVDIAATVEVPLFKCSGH